MAIVLSILLGISLSAAAGFKIFVPFLVLSIASNAGFVELSSGFAWIGSTPALILFIVATVIEIVAYYIPWLDNILDMIAAPAAVIAGVLLTASVIEDMSPMLKWTLAIIAGGGISGAIHAGTGLIRGASTTTTGGLANNIVASIENVSSTAISIFAIITPVLALVVLFIIMFFIFRFIKKRKAKKRLYKSPY